jgi:hypothetical protein
MAAGIALVLVASAPRAAVMTYTDRGQFASAIAALGGQTAEVIDFEGFTGENDPIVGDVIPSGSTIQGVTFTPALDTGFSLAVRGEGGTSGTNTLGTTNNGGASVGQFALGETLDFGFTQPTRAFGVEIIVSQNFDFFADDVNLSFAGTTLSNPIGDVGTPVNGQNALFLGIVDDAAGHASAGIQFGPTAGAFGQTLFELDDLRFTTPAAAQPTLSLTAPAGTDFGNVLVGSPSASLGFQVENTGSDGSTLTGTVGETADATGDFTTSADQPYSLGAGQTQSGTIEVTPSSRGLRQSVVGTSGSNVAPEQDLAYTANGVAPQQQVSDTAVDFGNVRIGTTAADDTTIENVGDGGLVGVNLQGGVGSAGGGEFSGGGQAIDLGDGASQTIPLGFAPTAFGAQAGTLAIDFTNGSADGTNSADSETVSLAGAGVGPEFSASAAPGSTLDFGPVAAGQTGLIELRVENLADYGGLGDALTGLTMTELMLTGVGTARLDIAGFVVGEVLSETEQLVLSLTFSPLAASDLLDAQLTLLTDQGAPFGGDGADFNFRLTGSAFAVPLPATTWLLLAGLLPLARRAQLLSRRRRGAGRGNRAYDPS